MSLLDELGRPIDQQLNRPFGNFQFGVQPTVPVDAGDIESLR